MEEDKQRILKLKFSMLLLSYPYHYEQSFGRLTWSLVMLIILEKKASVGYGVPCGSAYGIFCMVQISGC